jgi:hypothetical protein
VRTEALPVEPPWPVWYCLEEYCLVGCDTVEFGRSLPMFLKGCITIYQTPQHGVPEDSSFLENLCGEATLRNALRKTVIIITSLRASNLTHWTSPERLHRPPKRWCISARLHGVTSHKTAVYGPLYATFFETAVITSKVLCTLGPTIRWSAGDVTATLFSTACVWPGLKTCHLHVYPNRC